MKRQDSIVEELHKIREAIGRAHDFDVHRIAETIHRHERAAKRELIQVSPRKALRHKKAS